MVFPIVEYKFYINLEKARAEKLDGCANVYAGVTVCGMRMEAEAKYYGEFAPQRYLFEEYGINMEE